MATLLTEIVAKYDQFTKATKACELNIRSLEKVSKLSIMAISTAFAAVATVAIYKFADSVIDVTSKMGKLYDEAQKLEIGVAQFQKLEFAAGKAGVSTQILQTILGQMQKKLGNELVNPTERGVRALDMLGLSIRQLQNMSTFDRFRTIKEALGGIPDSLTRMGIAQQFFGRNSSQIFALLNTDIDSTMQKYANLRLLMTDSQAATLDNLDEQIELLGKIKEGFIEQTVASMAPALTDLTDFLITQIEKWGGLRSIAHDFGAYLVNTFLQVSAIVTDISIRMDKIALTFKELNRGSDMRNRDLLGVNDFFAKTDDLINRRAPGTSSVLSGASLGNGKLDQIMLDDDIDKLRKSIAAQEKFAQDLQNQREKTRSLNELPELSNVLYGAKEFSLLGKMVGDTLVGMHDKLKAASDGINKFGNTVQNVMMKLGEDILTNFTEKMNTINQLLNPSNGSSYLANAVGGQQLPQLQSEYFNEESKRLLEDVQAGRISQKEIKSRLLSLQQESDMQLALEGYDWTDKDTYSQVATNTDKNAAIEQMRKLLLDKEQQTIKVDVKVDVAPSKDFDIKAEAKARQVTAKMFEEEARKVAR